MKKKQSNGLAINPETIETTKPLTSKIILEIKKGLGFTPNIYSLMANNLA